MLFTKVVFKHKELENEQLEMADKKSLYFLGPELTMRNCTLILKASAMNVLIRAEARFIDCTFEVKQELKNHQQWVYAHLKGCRIKGRFSGCDFGCWPEYSEGLKQGSIEDCDFSEARLDGCRIMGSDPATLRFPKWPCFTIIDPIGRSRELNRVDWPGRVGSIIIEDLHTEPPDTRAVTLLAPALAKRYDTTEEDLRAAISRFDFILC